MYHQEIQAFVKKVRRLTAVYSCWHQFKDETSDLRPVRFDDRRSTIDSGERADVEDAIET